MYWTEEQVAEFELRQKLAAQMLRPGTLKPAELNKTSTKTPPRPKAKKATLGEWRELEFFIPRWIPSFKNSKVLGKVFAGRRKGKATTRTNPRYKSIMKAVSQDMASIRNANKLPYPLTNVRYKLRFHISNRGQDPDGATTTVLDCLQHAGLLRNDSFKHVVACDGVDHVVVKKQHEGVHVSIKGQELVEA